MRLIDADALKRKAQKNATEARKMKIKANVETILNQLINWIDSADTIELDILACGDCKYADDKPISDGRYWCSLNRAFMSYCSDAERREE